MNEDKKRFAIAVLVWLLVGLAFYMFGQDFRVASMRRLDYDITGFMTDSIRDRNGDACALVKVTPAGDFDFSGPYGIVRRVDKVGETWLYMPRGSRRITIKHPKWGVIRDYQFERPLEERVAYELRLDCPREEVVVRTDTITLTQTLTDTMVVERKRPRLPLRMHALLTVSGHRGGPSYGIMLALMRRHGAWVHARGNFRSGSHQYESSDPDGHIEGWSTLPYYTGKTRQSTYTLTAGLLHHLGKGILLMEGLGYGHQAITWQLDRSEDGGGYVRRSDLSGNRIAAELGLGYTRKHLTVMGSVTWVKDWNWQGTAGMGINF